MSHLPNIPHLICLIVMIIHLCLQERPEGRFGLAQCQNMAPLDSLQTDTAAVDELVRLLVDLEQRNDLPGLKRRLLRLLRYDKSLWIPWMDDAGSFEDITGTELDVGMHITPLPFVSIRLGYLGFELDFDRSGGLPGGGSSTSGYYIAGGFHW